MYISPELLNYFDELVEEYGVTTTFEAIETFLLSDPGKLSVAITLSALTYGIGDKLVLAGVSQGLVTALEAVGIPAGLYTIQGYYEKIIDNMYDPTFGNILGNCDTDNDGVYDVGIKLVSKHSFQTPLGISSTGYSIVTTNASVWERTDGVVRMIEDSFGQYKIYSGQDIRISLNSN